MRNIPDGEQRYRVLGDESFWIQDNVRGAMRSKGDEVFMLPAQANHLVAAGQLELFSDEPKKAPEVEKSEPAKLGEDGPSTVESAGDSPKPSEASPTPVETTAKSTDAAGARLPRRG